MLNSIRNLIDNAIAIDLGTANTLISIRNQGIVLNEPSVVAYKKGLDGSKKVVAVGNDAKKMLGRAPAGLEVIRPLKDGVIADFQVTEEMLRHYIHKIKVAKLWMKKPKVLVCVPCGATSVDRRAILESVQKSGAKSVQLISEGMAAAIGAELLVQEAKGVMVVDIGGGTSEIAVIALGGEVYAHSEKVGGDKFDEAIIQYIRRHYGCLIGSETAESIKMRIGSAYPLSEVLEMSVSGRAMHSGVPKQFTLTSNEILEALHIPLSMISESIRYALENTPPELVTDIATEGLTLTGGGAMLKNLAIFLQEELGISVRVANDPLTCVVRGSAKALEKPFTINNYQENSHESSLL
jgi:rod shape-determining protein MreB